jgi:hypothetical protein
VSKQPQKSRSQALPQVRELVRTQQSLHASLVQLQARVAGLAPRSALDDWYATGKIDGAEYVTIMLASGLDEGHAQDRLEAAHAASPPEGQPDPASAVIDPDLPQYSLPTRTVRRPPKRASELRGHPLD